ncbi:MAG: ATP-dependent DNA helicase [Patescibacteria group bacterium]
MPDRHLDKISDKFSLAYNKLNPAQKEAVDTIEGPVMVVAGPGTGKTQVLTLRIANILRETDTPPDGILALTFTNSGVHSMRERLVSLIGSRGYRVNINTFHGFCNEIIQNYPEEFPRIIGSSNASRVAQVKILEKIITDQEDKLKLKILRPYGAPFYYLPSLLSEIERLKKDNINFTDYLKSTENKVEENSKEQELALIYREYEQALRAQNLYDFADMIMEVLSVLKKKKSFLRKLQEEFLYILADEHQDANQSQNELLALLSNFHQSPNLFIVGDEKQAIFQFQGASLDNFNYFQKLYPEAKLISLTHSYRSHQTILDAAHSLIDSGKLLTANKLLPEKIKVLALRDTNLENYFLAQEIKEKIKAGVSPDEIAVIYRDNADADAIARALERESVAIVVQSNTNLLQDITISKIILILETIHHFGSESFLMRFLRLDFLGLDSLEVYKVKSYQDLKLTKNKELVEIYKKLEKWHRAGHNQNLLDVFSLVLEDSNLLNYLLKADQAEEKLAKVQAFYEEIRELAGSHHDYRLADFIDYLETLKRHSLGMNQTVLAAQSGVRLMTAHRSKGLEFEHVYIIGATDGHFGNRRKRSSFSKQEAEDENGERRLFYVALTRAKKSVSITYAKHTPDGRPQLASQFIEEIDKSLVEFIEPKDLQISAAETLKMKPVIKSSLSEKAYLNKIFLDRGMSVTDLNNYLSCPLKYFYQNLLRLTQVQEKHLLYGTAVHSTLKEFFDQYREDVKWREEKLLTRFKYHLEKQPFSPSDFTASLTKGEKALSGYLKWYKYQWPNRIVNEFSVRGVFLGDIKLNGKIDKLELGENGETRVVDYKTGKPKTRNHIMGLTKSAGSGDNIRQLIFYKLLLENFDKKYHVTSGLIDFIEPDEKARYKQEEFALSASDVADLSEQIRQVHSEILNLGFLSKGCGEKDCEWCHLWAVTH